MEKYNFWKSLAGEGLFELCRFNENIPQIPQNTTPSLVIGNHEG
jgi:hypothetical protein